MSKYFLNEGFVFALFIMAGFFKGNFNSPIDITLMFLVLSVLLFLVRFCKGGFKLQKSAIAPIVIFSVFAIAVLVSYIYTDSIFYAKEKLVLFLASTIWCFIGGVLVVDSKRNLNGFLTGVAMVSVSMTISTVIYYFENGISGIAFVTVMGTNYGMLGKASAFGIIIFVSLYSFTDTSKKLKLLVLFLICITLFPLLVSGARLPLLLTVITLGLIPLFLIKVTKTNIFFSKKLKSFLVYVLIGLVGFFAAFKKGLVDTFIYRINLLTQSGGLDEGRSIRFDTAFRMIEDNIIFGKGLGSFPLTFSGIDAEDYPHNLFLELWSESGIVPTIACVSLVYLAFYRGIKKAKFHNQQTFTRIVVLLLSIFAFLHIFISGSINESKFFWAYIGIMCSLPIILNTSENTSTQ